MNIEGPETYKLSCNPEYFTITCSKGTASFSGIAKIKKQKLYVVSKHHEILYVGATRQQMQPRLTTGWKAKGKGGYHGYPWRRDAREVELSIWLLDDDDRIQSKLDIETIEAEVVFLVRNAGQWPSHQHEIHFHTSKAAHREVALAIFTHCTSKL
jgi:hypothetical protein